MLSVIVPVYNESTTIINLLTYLEQISDSNYIKEIIIVDGGSSDDTFERVGNCLKGYSLSSSLISSEKGRARQMNAGARIASGDVLYFLHADSFPPKGYENRIIDAVTQGRTAGCFRMKFDNGHFLLRLSQWFTRFNFKACRGGDQSLFVTREIFEALNGYDESYKVYEDCELINRLYDKYSFTVLKDHVITSARKYKKNGTYRLQFHFAVIHLKKWTGASPNELSRYYYKYILT